jgi:hypothetical protein
MDLSKITSNFKLFSKTDAATATAYVEKGSASSPPLSSAFFSAQILLSFILFGLLTFAYYKKEDLQQFYDSHISRVIGQLWVYTHLNSNGELASTYVPDDFSMSKWIPSFFKGIILPE